MVGEEPALRALGEELGMEFVDLRNAEGRYRISKIIPAEADLSSLAVSAQSTQWFADVGDQ